MILDEQSVEAIAAALERRLYAAPLPGERLWDTDQSGAYLGVSRRQVAERLALMAGFPRAIRIVVPGASRARPRWKADEVVAWAMKHKDKEH